MKFLPIYTLVLLGCLNTALQADILDTALDTAQKYGVKALDALPFTAKRAYNILEDDFYKQLNIIKNGSSTIEAKNKAVDKAIDLSYQMLDVAETYFSQVAGSEEQNILKTKTQEIKDLQKNNDFSQIASIFKDIKMVLDKKIKSDFSPIRF